MPKTKEKQIVLKKDIVIPVGTIMKRSPIKREYVEPHYDTLIGYGKDHFATFTFNIDGIEEFSDDFEVVEE
jgi:hypothetical protein